MLVVAAAIVHDGRVLAGLRRDPAGWEFPGGKVEPGETQQQAIARECREELDITVTVLGHLATAGDVRVELALWHVELEGRAPQASTDHTELRWVDRDQLDELTWLDIDRALLDAVVPLLGTSSA